MEQQLTGSSPEEECEDAFTLLLQKLVLEFKHLADKSRPQKEEEEASEGDEIDKERRRARPVPHGKIWRAVQWYSSFKQLVVTEKSELFRLGEEKEVLKR